MCCRIAFHLLMLDYSAPVIKITVYRLACFGLVDFAKLDFVFGIRLVVSCLVIDQIDHLCARQIGLI